jgi:alkanesulfonate monooxygenase SsuD/methylene tetrahydromethanopterin reductase-like flavin-dependent oxidoreductase (luciferase family)
MGGPETNKPECYAMLSFLAAHTERGKLGAMVSGVHFKHPATCGGNGRANS